MPRKSRAAMARGMESRQANARRQPESGYKAYLYIDPRSVPTHVRYRWLAETVMGQPADQNMTRRMIEGWKPVPADRHPELLPPALPGRENQERPYLRRGGLILAERPVTEINADRERIRRENAAALKMVQWDDDMRRDEYMQPFVERHSPAPGRRGAMFKDE